MLGKFKVGNVIKCVNNDHVGNHLTLHKVYIVRGYIQKYFYENFVVIINDLKDIGCYNERRFILHVYDKLHRKLLK